MLRRSCESSDYDAPDTRILILQVSFGKSLSGSDLEQAGQGRCTHCCTRVYQQTSDCWFVGTGPDWRDARDECKTMTTSATAGCSCEVALTLRLHGNWILSRASRH